MDAQFAALCVQGHGDIVERQAGRLHVIQGQLGAHIERPQEIRRNRHRRRRTGFITGGTLCGRLHVAIEVDRIAVQFGNETAGRVERHGHRSRKSRFVELDLEVGQAHVVFAHLRCCVQYDARQHGGVGGRRRLGAEQAHHVARRERIDLYASLRRDRARVGKGLHGGIHVDAEHLQFERLQCDRLRIRIDFGAGCSELEARRLHGNPFNRAVQGRAAEHHHAGVHVETNARGEIDRAADARGLHVECQPAVNGHFLTSGVDTSQAEVGIGHRVAIARGRIDVSHRGVADVDARNFERRRTGPGIFSARVVGRFTIGLQVRPVAASPFIDAQVEPKTVDSRFTDRHLPSEDERHEPHAELRALEAGKGLVAEPRRIADARRTDPDSQPREQLQADIAFDGQLAARALVDGSLDLGTEIIGIEKQAKRHRRNDKQRYGRDDEPKYKLAGATHGTVREK